MAAPRRGKTASRRGVDAELDAPRLGRVPPYNAESELALLGSVFLDPLRVLDICSQNKITPESFWFPNNAKLYDAMLKMHAGGLPLDAVTVATKLHDDGLIDEVGGYEAIEKISGIAITSAAARFYAQNVAECHKLRQAIAISEDTIAKCYVRDATAAQILSEAEQQLMNMTSGGEEAKRSWDAALTDAFKQINKSLSDSTDAIAGISTGFQNIDKVLTGLKKGEMIVIAARPSVGKTSLAMNICENVAFGKGSKDLSKNVKNRKPVGVFSCEMSQDALIRRMIYAHAGISQQQIALGHVERSKATTALTRAVSELKGAQIFIDDTCGLDVMDLRTRARRMAHKNKIELIMIDYLQLLNSREYAQQGRQLETSNISSNIKAMAKELDIPVIVLSQLSRNPENRGKADSVPKLSDLRDSGAIEQDADVVMMLSRDSDPEHRRGGEGGMDPTQSYTGNYNVVNVNIAKNRNGATGVAKLWFQKERTTFVDYNGLEHSYGSPDAPMSDAQIAAADEGLEPQV